MMMSVDYAIVRRWNVPYRTGIKCTFAAVVQLVEMELVNSSPMSMTVWLRESGQACEMNAN